MLITEQEKFLGGNMTRGLSKPATRQQRESWVRAQMELLHCDSWSYCTGTAGVIALGQLELLHCDS